MLCRRDGVPGFDRVHEPRDATIGITIHDDDLAALQRTGGACASELSHVVAAVTSAAADDDATVLLHRHHVRMCRPPSTMITSPVT